MANIKLPTIDAYRTQDISILSASLLGDILEDNLKLIGSGVEIGLQSCMLKRRKISSNNSSEKAKSSSYFCLGEFASLESCLRVPSLSYQTP